MVYLSSDKMSSAEGEDGPRFVWTFPVVRMMSNRDGLILGQTKRPKLGSNVNKVRESVSDTVEGTVGKITGSEKVKSADDEELEDLTDKIESLDEGSSFSFSQESSLESGPNSIAISDGVFAPVRLEIEPGETVTWVNDGDEAHRLTSFIGETFTSPRLEPGEEFSHTFEDEGVVEYVDPNIGRGVMCGAVIVGDTDEELTLPCEQSQDFELFDSDEGEEKQSSTVASSPSMSKAAADKQDQERGFN